MKLDETRTMMVRARITPDIWERLQAVALKRNMPASQAIGQMIRDFVDLHDPQPVKGERTR